MTKPSDFFIGVVEFFAILLPGAALVYLLEPLAIAAAPKVWLPTTETQTWMAFLVLAYIAGHLLHQLGGWLLDKYIYGKFYLPRCRSSHALAKTLAKNPSALREDTNASKTLLARVCLTTQIDPTGTNYYDWCLSAVRVASPAGATEVDRLQADSKFFRSMVFVFLVAALISLREAAWLTSVSALVLMFFAGWRFCELRWTATKRVYEYYLLLDRRIQENTGAKDTV